MGAMSLGSHRMPELTEASHIELEQCADDASQLLIAVVGAPSPTAGARNAPDLRGLACPRRYGAFFLAENPGGLRTGG